MQVLARVRVPRVEVIRVAKVELMMVPIQGDQEKALEMAPLLQL